jgi:hypothetical protein
MLKISEQTANLAARAPIGALCLTPYAANAPALISGHVKHDKSGQKWDKTGQNRDKA